MRILQVFFYTALSVFLMTAGIPNEIFFFGMPFSGLVSLIPFYLALSECRNYREAGFATSLLFGCVHIFSSFWLANFKEFAIFTIGASSAFYFVEGWFTGLLFYVPFSMMPPSGQQFTERGNRFSFRTIQRILFFTCTWTLMEWIKSNGFLAYPWGTLILTAWKWKLLTQIMALTGMWGISFLFSLFAATAAEGIRLLSGIRQNTSHFSFRLKDSPYACAAFFTASLFVLSLIYGVVEYAEPRIPVKTMNAVLVQHNGDSWAGSEEDCILTAENLTRQAIESSGQKPDLVVWSEGILTYPLPDAWYYYDMIPFDESLQQSIRETGVPYIIGAPYVMDEDGTQFGNCAILIGPDAQIQDHYAKIHLVPFAEGIPFADKIWMQKLMKALAGFSDGWQAGTEYKTFTIQGTEPVRISTPVCFEDAFPSVCRQLYLAGSEVFVNITNDSWSLKKSSEYQHYVIASYRAIEYRTTLVRSTNGGYTAVTDPSGRILTELPLFEEVSVQTDVPVYERTMTTYTLLGDWLPLLAGVILFLLFIQYLHILHSHKILHTNMTFQ